ncbi:MAG: hypothetical protein ACFB50_07940 [Rubrobacteraceae bacterium]
MTYSRPSSKKGIMRRSTYCIQAERNARPKNSVEKSLIDLLKQPIQADQGNEIRKRADKLIALFSGLKANQASSLLSRLSDRNDYLGRLFKCELRTDFREALMEVLKDRVALASKTSKPPEPKPPVQHDGKQDNGEQDDKKQHDGKQHDGKQDDGEDDGKQDDKEPPEPPNRRDIIIDFDDYFKELFQWISDGRKATNDPSLLEKLRTLEELVNTAIVLLSTPILVQGMKYYVYSVISGRLVEIGTKKLEEEILRRGLHHLDSRIRSRTRHSPQFGQLERVLREITRLADEIEQDYSEKRKTADQSRELPESRRCCPPKALQLYRGRYTPQVRMDPKLAALACEIRATILPDGLSYEAFKKFNIAIAKVAIGRSIRYLHAANLPKSLAGSTDFPLHSEGDLTKQIYKLKEKNYPKDVEVKLLQLYTERIPCPDCKRLLDNLFSETAVYFTVGKKAPGGFSTKAIYLMKQYCVLATMLGPAKSLDNGSR